VADKPNNPVDFWEERYRTATTPWDRGGVSPALLQWLGSGELLPCRILVPGCGRGYEVLELARRGFEVVALDFAPSAVTHLQSELAVAGLAAEVAEANALTWSARSAFDAIYEQTCLCALPPKQWQAYEAQLHRWLRARGKLFALFMQTNRDGGPPYHCGLQAMETLFPSARWKWSDAPFCEIPHPAGIFELSTVLERLS
jgi:methyl halide transferase